MYGSVSRTRALFLAAALAFAVAGCSNKNKLDDAPAPAAASATAVSLPLDHVPNGALAEGTDSAYGVKVPFGFHISSRFEKEITLIGDVAPEKADAYIAAHVGGGKKFDYNGTTSYRGVRAPSAPDTPLDIDVSHYRFGSMIRIRDATPMPPPPTGMAPEDIMKGAGFDKNGKLLNRSKME
jgi:hypothetical protein